MRTQDGVSIEGVSIECAGVWPSRTQDECAALSSPTCPHIPQPTPNRRTCIPHPALYTNRVDGGVGCVSQANEMFRNGEIGYMDIFKVIEKTMEGHKADINMAPSLEEIVEVSPTPHPLNPRPTTPLVPETRNLEARTFGPGIRNQKRGPRTRNQKPSEQLISTGPERRMNVIAQEPLNPNPQTLKHKAQP